MWSCEPPSLETLEGRFPRQRHDLETIVSMSEQDSQVVRIDPTFLINRQNQSTEFGSETGITQERWNQYRRLFGRNDISQGIQHDPQTGDAFIMVQSTGLLDRGYSNGYLYCGPGPKHAYPPCYSSKPSGEHPYKEGDEGYSYRKLADRWYAYGRGPG